jgi:hypothetical protein
MTYRGHVRNGQILLDEPVELPEGVAVDIELPAQVFQKPSVRISRPERSLPLAKFEPLELPGSSLADELVHDRR